MGELVLWSIFDAKFCQIEKESDIFLLM